MKKLILLLGILSMGAECGVYREPDYMSNYGQWGVKNTTDRPLNVKYGTEIERIASGGTLLFYRDNYQIWKTPDFDDVLSRWGNWADENISFAVLSTGGDELVRWKYVDRDEAGKQFFKEDSWVYDQYDADREDELKCVWVFEIKNEDIAP